MKATINLALATLVLAAFNVSAQTETELEIQTYAGLTITGEVGKVYSVEYVTDLTEPAESDWRCLEYLQLPASPYLWADKSTPATGKRFYRAEAMEAPTNMVFIPPGMLRMGSPTSGVGRSHYEGPQTAVTISRGYWMGKYEVTQGEYLAVMWSNPWTLQCVVANCAAVRTRDSSSGRSVTMAGVLPNPVRSSDASFPRTGRRCESVGIAAPLDHIRP